ncbi:MAG: hypothetical protein IJK89_04165 [Clostridia bacterium]|nr:hypothetical protein [Clostridia bacterium]
MSTLKALMRVRLASFKQIYLGKSKTKSGKERNKALILAVLLVYVTVTFGIMFVGNFSMMAEAFAAQGLDWVYFAMWALLDFAVMFVGTVFAAKTQLYEAKDNDLLLAMPIKPRDILISRLFTILVINGFINLIISAAAGIMWIVRFPVSPMGAAAFVLVALVLPLFTLAMSALFGFLISLATRRVRNKSVVTTVFSLVFFGAYMYVVNKSTTWIQSLSYMGGYVADALRPVFLLRWIGDAVAKGDAKCLALTLACLLVPFALAVLILDRTFFKNITTVRSAAKKEYKEKSYGVEKSSSALFKKEAARFVSSSGYMLNAGFGAVMAVAAGVLVLVKREFLSLFFSNGAVPPEYLFPILVTGLCLMAAMTDISAPSVSLEGKSLWILRSSPVDAADVLRAKLKFHCAVSGVATLIASVLVCIAVQAAPVQWALGIVLPQLFVAFEGLLGLLCNLKYPILDWENENQAVKTGMAVFIAMFGAMGAVFALGGVWFGLSAFLPAELALCADILLLAAVDALLYRRLVTKGAEAFAAL